MNEKTKWMYMYGPHDGRRVGCRYGAVPDQGCLKKKEKDVDCTICPRNIEVGREVFVKSEGRKAMVRILEGIPPRKAWVETYPGACGNYFYMTMYDPDVNVPYTTTLNVYDIKDLRGYK